MARNCLASPKVLALALAAAFLASQRAAGQPGVMLSGVGPVDRSRAGASTAAPLDASGALYWNPATIVGLERSEAEFGLELLHPRTEVSSTVPPGAIGGLFPPVEISGLSRGHNGVFPMPSFGYVYKPTEDPDLALGVGLFAVGGFGVNYPGSLTNPVLSPRPPVGLGAGPLYTQFQVLQFVPTAAYRVADGLSVGFAPTLNLALLQLDPGLVAPPDDANGDGFATYPALTHGRYHLGGGFQAGLHYTPDDVWGFGFTFKSPQWFETFRWQTADELGRPREDRFRLNYPMILSTGVAYQGIERWLLSADLRYVDYANTPGFRESGFGPRGEQRGVGWDSVFALALGAQYRWSDCVALRCGYSYNQNPIDDLQTSFNVGSPLLVEHALYFGASHRITPDVLVSWAYVHGFANSVEGPIVTPLGPIPGSRVRSELTSVDALVLGLTVQFGPPFCRY